MKNVVISQRLRTLRENLGKSQAQLAQLNGTITQPAIYRYERGVTDVPNDILLWYADFSTFRSIIYTGERISRRENCIITFRKPSTTIK